MRGLLLRASENGSGRRARRPSLVAALICATALPLAAATPAAADTYLFTYTGAEQEFEVPDGVHLLKFVAIGGVGGSSSSASGGEAAEIAGSLNVVPKETLYIEVGGKGKSEEEGGAGGFNGGGSGGAGGGGATDIRTLPLASGLSPQDTRLVVAAGGGGAGATGGTNGTNGGAAGSSGGGGEYAGGGAGTESEGGEGAEGCEAGGPNRTGADGQRGIGGAGGNAEYSTGPGGGGGGGLFGGGGGAGSCTVGSTGGGGGSSLQPSVSLLTWTSVAPKVELKYNLPPTVTIANPVSGATFTQGQAVKADFSCAPGAGTSLKACNGTVANGALLDTSILGNHSFTVEAEGSDKGTDSETVVYSVVAPGKEQPPPPPNTILGSHPKGTIKTAKSKAKVKFAFSSDVASSTFECKLDKGAYASCASPKTYKVKLGSHSFSVRAKSAGGVDSTPATFRFKVKKKA